MKSEICTLTIVDSYQSDKYRFLLGVSTDTLVVLDSNERLVEWIVEGKDDNGVIAQAENEDYFLDAILTIKSMITKGLNPLTWLS